MSGGAIVFMAASWSLVLGLTSWSYWRLLRGRVKAEMP